jgi:hypothetical protein
MEHAGEVEFGGQLQRCETVSGNTELGQRFVVGSARENVRKHGCFGVVRGESAYHRVDEWAGERVLEPYILMEYYDFDLVTDERADFGEHSIFFAGNSADVDEGFCGVGDDVVLVAGVEQRGV